MAERQGGTRWRIVGGVLALAALLTAGRFLTSGAPTGRAAGSPAAGCAAGGGYEALPDDEVEVDARLRQLPEGDGVVPNRFVVRLAQEASPRFERLATGRVKSGNPRLDEELERFRFVRPIVDDPDAGEPTELDGVMVLETTAPLAEVVRDLGLYGEVQYVEPVAEVHALATPSDPYYPYQWHLDMLDVGAAHDRTDGAGATVAVLDTGVSGGSDGFLDFGGGYNCIDGNRDVTDRNGHGTHVAGTIAQATSNGEGVAGVAPGVRLLAFKVLGDDGTGDTAALATCIRKAVWWGADVINMSLGGATGSSVVEDALRLAEAKGVTVVAATGNDGLADGVYYPAAYDTVIAVGAVGPSGDVAPYSNRGSEVDVVAPGGDMSKDLDSDGFPDGVLQQTVSGSGWTYAFYQGTSMAAPHVAGAAALLYADGATLPADVRAALSGTAQDLGAPGRDDTYGSGLIDVNAAFDYTPPVPVVPAITSIAVTHRSGTWVTVDVTTDLPTTAVLTEWDTKLERPKRVLATSHRWWLQVTVERSVRIVVTTEAGGEARKWRLLTPR